MKLVYEISEVERHNPRNDYNLTKMALCHKKYDLADKGEEFDPTNYDSWEEIKQMLIKERGAKVIVQVSMTDHSGISIYPGQPNCQWDAGIIGFCYMTEKDIKENYGDLSDRSLASAESNIKAEIEEYSRYLEGEPSYCASINNAENDEWIDGCTFGDEEEAEQWAKDYIEAEENLDEKSDDAFVKAEQENRYLDMVDGFAEFLNSANDSAIEKLADSLKEKLNENGVEKLLGLAILNAGIEGE